MSLPSTSSFLFQEDTEHTSLEVILQGSQLLRIDNEESYSQVGKNAYFPQSTSGKGW